ncbi:MAG: hypothetical protein AAFQ07_14955, partial [Chloroflexota bacterium]
ETFGEDSVPLMPEESYRVSRIRMAQYFHISPKEVDSWDVQTYYDVLDVVSADDALRKLNS